MVVVVVMVLVRSKKAQRRARDTYSITKVARQLTATPPSDRTWGKTGTGPGKETETKYKQEGDAEYRLFARHCQPVATLHQHPASEGTDMCLLRAAGYKTMYFLGVTWQRCDTNTKPISGAEHQATFGWHWYES